MKRWIVLPILMGVTLAILVAHGSLLLRARKKLREQNAQRTTEITNLQRLIGAAEMIPTHEAELKRRSM